MSHELYNIVGGPRKQDLLSALGNVEAGQTVEFKYSQGRRLDGSKFKIHTKTIITALEHKGGDTWDFKGYAEMPNGNRERVEGIYSTHNRFGYFKIIT